MKKNYALYLTAATASEESDKATAAIEVCWMRGQSPTEPVKVSWGSLPRWRAILLEALLMGTITGALDTIDAD